MWYLSGDPSVKNIGKFAKIWLDIQDENGNVESNYGTYLMGSQWMWVLKELQRDKDSRRCTMVVHQPMHKQKNQADLPCTQYIQFFIWISVYIVGFPQTRSPFDYIYANKIVFVEPIGSN